MISLRGSWWVGGTALACIAVGVVLSRVTEPGVQVKSLTLAGDTPGLQFLPPGAGPHPVALLAHGVTASKETLFRFGEALAAGGFVCYAFDFPGHGESPEPFRPRLIMRAPGRVAKALGTVDVFLGHSMGAWVGGAAVEEGSLKPRLFVAVGAVPKFGPGGPPLLLLAGAIEEAVPPGWLKARTDARLVISPWSDHALEPYDPILVDAAVQAACAAVGKVTPAAPTRWVWRVAGEVLGMAGALGLALWLPALPARWGWARGPAVAVVVLATMACVTTTWLGGDPVLRRVPQQVVFMAVALFVISGAGKLRIPRWSFVVFAAAVALGSVIVSLHLLAMFVWCGALILGWGTLIGAIAARRGSRRDGDFAMAIFLGYAIGQWLPMFY
jgi:pimeloyl-ACP methyl ester carboxylesterase